MVTNSVPGSLPLCERPERSSWDRGCTCKASVPLMCATIDGVRSTSSSGQHKVCGRKPGALCSETFAAACFRFSAAPLHAVHLSCSTALIDGRFWEPGPGYSPAAISGQSEPRYRQRGDMIYLELRLLSMRRPTPAHDAGRSGNKLRKVSQ